MRVLRTATAVLGLALASVTAAFSQSYPSRPITLIVPFPPGGATDAISRVLIEPMRASLGQPIVIENVAGGGGNTGVQRVLRSEPDGYTLVIGHWGSHVVNGATYNLSYDLLTDFEPIAWIASTPQWIITRKTMPANNLAELIAWLKANADKATQGNSGIGTPSHVGGVLFQNAIGTRFQLVPYRGAGQTMQDLLAGNIDVVLDTPALSLPQVRGGHIKAYAVTAKHRLAAAPEIPTTDEAGLPGFYFSFWHAFWAPKGTPRDAIGKLNAAVVSTLTDPVIRQKLVDLSQEIFPPEQLSPEALAAYQQAEIDKWWPIIRAANIKIE